MAPFASAASITRPREGLNRMNQTRFVVATIDPSCGAYPFAPVSSTMAVLPTDHLCVPLIGVARKRRIGTGLWFDESPVLVAPQSNQRSFEEGCHAKWALVLWVQS